MSLINAIPDKERTALGRDLMASTGPLRFAGIGSAVSAAERILGNLDTLFTGLRNYDGTNIRYEQEGGRIASVPVYVVGGQIGKRQSAGY